MPIIDWELKQKIAQVALKEDEVRSVYSRAKPGADISWIEDAIDRARKWKVNTPSKKWQSELLQPILNLLCVKPSYTVQDFIKSDVSSFIEALPSDKRDDAQQARADYLAAIKGEIAGSVLPEPACIESFTRHTETTLPQVTIAQGAKSGIVDPHTYYSSAEGAEKWKHIIDSDHYATYFHCKQALASVLKDDAWNKSILAMPITASYSLGGGGSPAKDWSLLNWMLSKSEWSKKHITLTLVDINPYMLQQSRVQLANWVRESHDARRFVVRFFQDDILDFGQPDAKRQEVQRREGNALFTIYGGTIGNMSESRLFAMLDRVAKSGDHLLVGCTIVDGKKQEEVLALEESKYKEDRVLQLIRPGVDCVIRQNGLPWTTKSGLEQVKVEIWAEGQSTLSDVRGSMTLVLVLTAGKKKIALLRSARYQQDELIQFAGHHGWEFVTAVASPLCNEYKQIGFRRR
jgi:Histidine-specific methyltransferase, SAM-dependent